MGRLAADWVTGPWHPGCLVVLELLKLPFNNCYYVAARGGRGTHASPADLHHILDQEVLQLKVRSADTPVTCYDPTEARSAQ